MLLPASFRGVPFAVTQSDTSGGRRIALHQYPGRDKPWAEDMGRAPRRFRLRGFVLDGDVILGGLPVELQRILLVNAVEKKGPGTLTHPTLGVVNVALERGSISEGLGANSYSEIELEFVESGQQSFPAASSSSALGQIASAVLKVVTAVEAISAIAHAFAGGGSRAEASGAAAGWSARMATSAIDATAMHRIAADLSGNFGRYSAGANAGLSGVNASPYALGTSVADVIPIASANRQAIIAAAAAFATAIENADLTNADAVPAAADAMVAALVAACADPADAMRLLLKLLSSQTLGLAPEITAAVDQLVLRSAAAALTVVASRYQPRSADDAAARIAAIAPVLDALMTIAADTRADDCAAALRQCRGAVVTDLRNRGATLARIRSFRFAMPLPALVLAQDIYADPTRADQLVDQAAPAHPLFMPVEFEALAA